jgi:hypothetical protein
VFRERPSPLFSRSHLLRLAVARDDYLALNFPVDSVHSHRPAGKSKCALSARASRRLATNLREKYGLALVMPCMVGQGVHFDR